jgi:hypothetical protein
MHHDAVLGICLFPTAFPTTTERTRPWILPLSARLRTSIWPLLPRSLGPLPRHTQQYIRWAGVTTRMGPTQLRCAIVRGSTSHRMCARRMDPSVLRGTACCGPLLSVSPAATASPAQRRLTGLTNHSRCNYKRATRTCSSLVWLMPHCVMQQLPLVPLWRMPHTMLDRWTLTTGVHRLHHHRSHPPPLLHRRPNRHHSRLPHPIMPVVPGLTGIRRIALRHALSTYCNPLSMGLPTALPSAL